MLILLGYLFFRSLTQIDIAATKNDALTQFSKSKIDGLQSIDSVKYEAKKSLDLIRQNFKDSSNLATKRLWIISVLIIVQIILLIGRRGWFKKRYL